MAGVSLNILCAAVIAERTGMDSAAVQAASSRLAESFPASI